MTVRVVLPENYLPGYELYYYEYNGDVIKSLRPKSMPIMRKINLPKIMRFIEFDVEEVTLRNFSELPKGYEAFMTPNVTAASFEYCDIKMNTLLNLLPNIERLRLTPNLESDWEDLFDYKYPLNDVFIRTSKIKNWKKVSEFLKRQDKGFDGCIFGLNPLEEGKAMNYFKVIDFEKDPQQLNDNFIFWYPNYKLYCK
uniref:Uncharacterized protein n=1 Tax=Panagrolaimus sp. JU765 TaxID=591449 RepID=A0AC34RD09_9BILA